MPKAADIAAIIPTNPRNPFNKFGIKDNANILSTAGSNANDTRLIATATA